MLLGETANALRQPELLEARHLARDHAEGKRDRAALAKAVDAEARQALRRVGDVELAGLVEDGKLGRREVGDQCERRLEIAVEQGRMVREQAELAVPPHDGRLADFQMDVARAELDGARQYRIQVHGVVIGTDAAPLESAQSRQCATVRRSSRSE